MVEDASLSVFVPVLVLVIIEVSQAAREFDLVEIAERKQEPFFYSVVYLLHRSPQEVIRVPQLGPFNFIHGMNLAILNLGYVLVVLVGEGNVRIVTALILWLIWVLFPMLEVYEYVAIMSTPGVGPVSFLYHSIVTTIAAVVIFASGGVLETPAGVAAFDPTTLLFVATVVVIFYLSLFGYLSLLERELERVSRAG